ncbi:MAG: hypothetical protein HRU09_10795 [Oligoflexales bacterium]|nr:hypothetical protein [Oligoflexales bacterium]
MKSIFAIILILLVNIAPKSEISMKASDVTLTKNTKGKQKVGSGGWG